jgi:hypothetical protein
MDRWTPESREPHSNATDERTVHVWKASSPMNSIDAGRWIDRSFGQYEKASFSIDISSDPVSKVTLDKLTHGSNLDQSGRPGAECRSM